MFRSPGAAVSAAFLLIIIVLAFLGPSVFGFDPLAQDIAAMLEPNVGRFIGIEHPSGRTSVERILAVWKGQTIPQPSLFWTPAAWRARDFDRAWPRRRASSRS